MGAISTMTSSSQAALPPQEAIVPTSILSSTNHDAEKQALAMKPDALVLRPFVSANQDAPEWLRDAEATFRHHAWRFRTTLSERVMLDAVRLALKVDREVANWSATLTCITWEQFKKEFVAKYIARRESYDVHKEIMFARKRSGQSMKQFLGYYLDLLDRLRLTDPDYLFTKDRSLIVSFIANLPEIYESALMKRRPYEEGWVFKDVINEVHTLSNSLEERRGVVHYNSAQKSFDYPAAPTKTAPKSPPPAPRANSITKVEAAPLPPPAPVAKVAAPASVAKIPPPAPATKVEKMSSVYNDGSTRPASHDTPASRPASSSSYAAPHHDKYGMGSSYSSNLFWLDHNNQIRTTVENFEANYRLNPDACRGCGKLGHSLQRCALATSVIYKAKRKADDALMSSAIVEKRHRQEERRSLSPDRRAYESRRRYADSPPPTDARKRYSESRRESPEPRSSRHGESSRRSSRDRYDESRRSERKVVDRYEESRKSSSSVKAERSSRSGSPQSEKRDKALLSEHDATALAKQILQMMSAKK